MMAVKLLLILLAPGVGGLLTGLERRLRARMQNRQGPPLLQPFFDLAKLCDKRRLLIHPLHGLLALAHLLATWLALAVLLMGHDLLLAVFLHLGAMLLLVTAGFSARSPYSQLGAKRELIVLMASEPLLLLAAIGLGLIGNSLAVADIASLSQPPLPQLWPLFAALLMALPALTQKSPFDVAEAHQELIGGLEVEFSGLYYGAVLTARWLDMLFVYLFLALFGGGSWLLGLGLAGGSLLLVNLIDNALPRFTTNHLLRGLLFGGLPLAAVNLYLLLLRC